MIEFHHRDMFLHIPVPTPKKSTNSFQASTILCLHPNLKQSSVFLQNNTFRENALLLSGVTCLVTGIYRSNF